jgi:DNA-binding response OmpR family regulator
VLVVDDDENARFLIGTVLQQAGYRVTPAADGEAGLALIREQSPDLVVLDVQLPGMDGYAVCRELRREPRGRDVLVLMMSGHEDEESLRRAREAGANDFMVKASGWRAFAERVARLLPRTA